MRGSWRLGLWIVLLVAAALTGLLAWIDRVRPRPRYGDCQICGFDLTCNTTGVCPECGTPDHFVDT